MESKKAFNGTSKELRSLFKEWRENGGDSKSFNAQFSSITADGRAVKGLRTDGLDKKTGKMKLKINYSAVVDSYEGNRREHIKLSTPDPAKRKAGAQVFEDNKGRGTDVDHKIRVERTGRPLQEMTPARRTQYHQNFGNAGIAIGDDPKNLEESDRAFNRGQDKKEHSDLDKRIKRIEGDSPTQNQLKITGTTSRVGRQQRAQQIQRGLPGFPTPRNKFDYRMNGLGGAAGLMMDPEAAKKFAQGDIQGGLQTGAGSFIQGEAISQIGQRVLPHLSKLFARAAPVVVPVLKALGPVGTAVGGTQVANEFVKAGTGEGFIKKIQNVQDKPRTKAINDQAYQTTQQLAIKRKQTGQDQSFPNQVTNVIEENLNHLEYAIKNPLSIFGIK